MATKLTNKVYPAKFVVFINVHLRVVHYVAGWAGWTIWTCLYNWILAIDCADSGCYLQPNLPPHIASVVITSWANNSQVSRPSQDVLLIWAWLRPHAAEFSLESSLNMNNWLLMALIRFTILLFSEDCEHDVWLRLHSSAFHSEFYIFETMLRCQMLCIKYGRDVERCIIYSLNDFCNC